MVKLNSLLVSVMVLLLTGCGSPEPAGDEGSLPGTETETKTEARVEEGVFDPLVGTMDRAKAVNEVAAGRKNDLDSQIDGSD